MILYKKAQLGIRTSLAPAVSQPVTPQLSTNIQPIGLQQGAAPNPKGFFARNEGETAIDLVNRFNTTADKRKGFLKSEYARARGDEEREQAQYEIDKYNQTYEDQRSYMKDTYDDELKEWRKGYNKDVRQHNRRSRN
jgi:hypothetical protein